MTAHIIAKNVGVEFPIFNSSHRSLKKSILNVSTGGRVAQDSKNHVVVRALDAKQGRAGHPPERA